MDIKELFDLYVKDNSTVTDIYIFLNKFTDNNDMFFTFFNFLSKEQKEKYYEYEFGNQQLMLKIQYLEIELFNKYFFPDFVKHVKRDKLLDVANNEIQKNNKLLQEHVSNFERQVNLNFDQVIYATHNAYVKGEVELYNFYLEKYKNKFENIGKYAYNSKVWESIYYCLCNSKDINELIEKSKILKIENIFKHSDKLKSYIKFKNNYQIDTTDTYFLNTVLPMMKAVPNSYVRNNIFNIFFNLQYNDESIELFLKRKHSYQFYEFFLECVPKLAKACSQTAKDADSNATLEFYLRAFYGSKAIQKKYYGKIDFNKWVDTMVDYTLVKKQAEILSNEIKNPKNPKNIKI